MPFGTRAEGARENGGELTAEAQTGGGQKLLLLKNSAIKMAF